MPPGSTTNSIASADVDTIVDVRGDARLVLTGEVSHGTHDLYAVRAAVMRRRGKCRRRIRTRCSVPLPRRSNVSTG